MTKNNQLGRDTNEFGTQFAQCRCMSNVRDIRDMCPDCQHPYSMHSHGGEGENTYPVCPPDRRAVPGFCDVGH